MLRARFEYGALYIVSSDVTNMMILKVYNLLQFFSIKFQHVYIYVYRSICGLFDDKWIGLFNTAQVTHVCIAHQCGFPKKYSASDPSLL